MAFAGVSRQPRLLDKTARRRRPVPVNPTLITTTEKNLPPLATMTRHRDDDAEEEADVEMETRRDVDDGNESEDAPEGEYVVESILEAASQGQGKWMYHVKWEGYDDPNDNTWEPEENLSSAPEVLKAFWAGQEGLRARFNPGLRSRKLKSPQQPPASRERASSVASSTSRAANNASTSSASQSTPKARSTLSKRVHIEFVDSDDDLPLAVKTQQQPAAANKRKTAPATTPITTGQRAVKDSDEEPKSASKDPSPSVAKGKAATISKPLSRQPSTSSEEARNPKRARSSTLAASDLAPTASSRSSEPPKKKRSTTKAVTKPTPNPRASKVAETQQPTSSTPPASTSTTADSGAAAQQTLYPDTMIEETVKDGRYDEMESWEDLVDEVYAIEMSGRDGIIVYLSLITGEKLAAPNDRVKKKCPLKLFAYYEGRLKWKPKPPSR